MKHSGNNQESNGYLVPNYCSYSHRTFVGKRTEVELSTSFDKSLPVDIGKTYNLVYRGRLYRRKRGRTLEMASLAFFFLLLLNVASAQGEYNED